MANTCVIMAVSYTQYLSTIISQLLNKSHTHKKRNSQRQND